MVWPPPCNARCVLSCADISSLVISYYISASVTLGRRFNAASKTNNTDRIYIHIFYIQMPINFLMKSLLKTTLSIVTYIILINRIRVLIEAVAQRFSVGLQLCFPVNFAEFLRTPFLTEHLWWPFLLKLLLVTCYLVKLLLIKCSSFIFIVIPNTIPVAARRISEWF